MAVLGTNSLTGCTSIPSFIAAGTKMIFQNATSPTSWTKDTTVNQGMLRVISGATLTPGGTTPFSTIFVSAKPFSGNSGSTTIPFTISPNLSSQVTWTVASANLFPSPGISGATTLSTLTMGSHTHPVFEAGTLTQLTKSGPGVFDPYVGGGGQEFPINVTSPTLGVTGSSPASGGGSHSHTFSAPHTHPSPATSTHNHPGSAANSHLHTISGTFDFNVLYVDMIIATKA